MSKFCRKCGAPLQAGVHFCSECGTAISQDRTPSILQHETKRAAPIIVPAKTGSKAMKVALVAVTAILLIGGIGAAVWVNMPTQALSKELAEQLLNSDIDSNPRHLAFWKEHFCVANFDYSAEDVHINDNDGGQTKRWLDNLAAGGIYQALGSEEIGDEWNSEIIWKYQLTPAGAKSVQNGMLCFAERPDFKAEGEASKPRKIGTDTVTLVQFSYAPHEAAKWSQTQTAKELVPEIAEKSHGKWEQVFVLKDSKWTVPDDASAALLLQQAKEDMQAGESGAASDKSLGFLDRALQFLGMDTQPTASYFGQWESDSLLGQDLNVTLEADSITIMGARTEDISYVPRPNSDWIRVRNTEGVNLLEIRVLNHETLEYKFMDVLNGKLHRIGH